MENSASGGTATLGEFADAMRRRWWMLALGALIGVALASAYLFVAPNTYIATASVQVYLVGGDSDNTVEDARTVSDINMDTEAQLVRSQSVSSLAAEELGTQEKIGQLVQRVTVTVPPNTSVLRISFSDATAVKAYKGATAYADAYIENRRASAEANNAALENALQEQLTRLENRYARPTTTEVEREFIGAEIDAINFRLNSMITAITPGTVISDAVPPNRPSSPNLPLVLFSGFAFGILIGMLGVATFERRDGRIYDWRIVERRLDLPVLANVPVKRHESPALLPVHSPGGQAYSELRNVLLSGVTSSGGVIVVAEPEWGSGADAVSANLAASFARADYKTTLLVADVASTVPAMLGVPHGPGLAEALLGSAGVADVSRSVTGVKGLSVISPGLGLETDVEDLEGAGIGQTLRALRERSRIVIVRAPVASADAQLLARLSDVTVAVVELGRTHREALMVAVRQWSLVGATVPGVVTMPALGKGPDPILVGPKKIERSGVKLSRAPASR
jgi:capsular polysaccharide biosynthesis protein